MPRAPATGQSTFSFDLKPHSSSDTVWRHLRGQVQIDALFVGRRDGEELIFVVEAKHGSYPSSLAKHKLVYPVLAIAPQVSKYLRIVPVYVRVARLDGDLHFFVAECFL